MFTPGFPIAFDAPAELKKWPSLNNQRRGDAYRPYLVFKGTLAECVQQLLSKHIRGICLYEVIAELEPGREPVILSPADAAELAMRWDFPKSPFPIRPIPNNPVATRQAGWPSACRSLHPNNKISSAPRAPLAP